MKVRLLDHEAGKKLGNLVTGYSKDYQVRKNSGFQRKNLISISGGSPLDATNTFELGNNLHGDGLLQAPLLGHPHHHPRPWRHLLRQQSCHQWPRYPENQLCHIISGDDVKKKFSFSFHFRLPCTEINHFMKGGCGHQDNLSTFQKHLPRILSHLSSCFLQSFVSSHFLLSQENSVLGFL